MHRAALMSGAGLVAGGLAGIPLASLYLNHAMGLGLNDGSPFSVLAEFPRLASLAHGAWPTVLKIIGGTGLGFAAGGLALSLRQDLTRFGSARFQERWELKRSGLRQKLGEGLVFGKLGRPGVARPISPPPSTGSRIASSWRRPARARAWAT